MSPLRGQVHPGPQVGGVALAPDDPGTSRGVCRHRAEVAGETAADQPALLVEEQ